MINKFSTLMTSPEPAFQKCTGSCFENVSTPKAVSSDLRSTDSLTVLARIEIVAILIHYQPSYNTSHTQWNPVTQCCSPMSRNVFCRQNWHLSTPSHLWVPSKWLFCLQAQCWRWFTVTSWPQVILKCLPPFAWITGPATDPSLLFHKSLLS